MKSITVHQQNSKYITETLVIAPHLRQGWVLYYLTFLCEERDVTPPSQKKSSYSKLVLNVYFWGKQKQWPFSKMAKIS